MSSAVHLSQPAKSGNSWYTRQIRSRNYSNIIKAKTGSSFFFVEAAALK